MLVLIVVSAATAFSLFIAGYQKQVQQKQAIQQAKSLESIQVVRVTPTLNQSSPRYAFLNFTVASLYVNSATIREVSINNNPLKTYNAWRLDLSSATYQWVTIGPGGQLAMNAREQLNLLIDLTGDSGFSFYNGSFVLHSTDFVKVELITAYGNDFSRIFIPPTAIGIVSVLETLNGSVFTPVTVLDGTHSFQPGNGSIVQWIWNVTPDNITPAPYGPLAVVHFKGAYLEHTITLMVTDSDGLIGTEVFRYP